MKCHNFVSIQHFHSQYCMWLAVILDLGCARCGFSDIAHTIVEIWRNLIHLWFSGLIFVPSSKSCLLATTWTSPSIFLGNFLEVICLCLLPRVERVSGPRSCALSITPNSLCLSPPLPLSLQVPEICLFFVRFHYCNKSALLGLSEFLLIRLSK